MIQNRTSGEAPKGDLRDTAREVDEASSELGRWGNPDARDQCRLGNLYTQSALYEYAINAYKRAIQFDPNYATAHHKLGTVYYKTGLFNEAREEMKKAISLRPDVPLFHYTLGILQKDDKKFHEAISSFTKSIELDPDYIKAYYRRGFAHFYNGDVEKACSDLEKVIGLDEAFQDALYNLGVIYISLGRWEDAQRLFEQHLILKPSDADAFYHMGLICVGSRGDSEQAIENFQQALELDPGHLKARFQLSLIHARKRYREPSHKQQAIIQLRTLIELYQELGDFDRIHDAFFILGSLYDDDPEDSDLAIEVYKNGLQIAGWYAEAHNNLGVLYSQKGLMDDAVSEFREAIRLDPDYESPYRNLAKIYFYQRNEEIMKDFQQWIKESPDTSAKILFNLSLALMDVGRAEAYESIYSRAHRIKNLIGVAGSKLRRVCRKIDDSTQEQLTEVLTDQEKCYNEMVNLLGTLKQDDMLMDMVNVNATIESVLRQMGFKTDSQSDCGILYIKDGNFPKVECCLVLEGNLPQVNGDPRKLKEVFNNVVINALEAIKDSGELKINTKYLEPSSVVEVVIQDNGVGIAPEHLDNILKPGYTTKETGSGFGLSIVERIIKEHKGSIHISSSKDKGAEVKIHLPVNLESAPIQTNLRMRPVIYEDPNELMFTEVDKILGI
jgi:tetratricopeptide (TPR) repeat protein